jgi:hypothetical protein
MITMLLGIAMALFCVGFYFEIRWLRTMRRMVDEIRAGAPSERFSQFFWIKAMKHHRSRFPESGLRRRMLREYACGWLFWGGGFVLLVVSMLRGGWLR